MKSLCLYLSLLVLCFSFSHCQSDDSRLFRKNADERLDEVLQAYKKALIEAPNGWKVTYFPDTASCGAWNFVMKFTEDGQVSMKSDYLEHDTLYSGKGLYQVKDFEGPGLSFATFLPITELAEADPLFPSASEGENDFLFKKKTADTIYLKGRKRGADFVLTHATAADWTAIDQHQKSVAALDVLRPQKSIYQKIKFTANAAQGRLRYDQKHRYADIITLDEKGNAVKVTHSGMIFTDTGILFSNPITNGDKKYASLVYDSTNDRFVDRLNSPGIQIDFSIDAYEDVATEPLGFRRFSFMVAPDPYTTNGFLSKFMNLYALIVPTGYMIYQVDLIFNIDRNPSSKKKNEIFFMALNPQKQDKPDFKRNIRVYFDLKKADGKVFLTPTDAKDDTHTDTLQINPEVLSKALAPINDFFFDKKGLKVAHTGKYTGSLDESYTFTSVTDSLIRVYTLPAKE